MTVSALDSPIFRDLCRGEAGNFCHWEATTQDITDSATALQIRASFDQLAQNLDRAVAATAKLAGEHRSRPMAARSNLQQAVPQTFGFKMARLLATLRRHRARFAEIRPRIEVVEFGGAAGTLASLGASAASASCCSPTPTWRGASARTRSAASPIL